MHKFDTLIPVLESIKEHEGFSERPYQDSLGHWTIGYGFTSLTEEEADELLHYRIEQINDELYNDGLASKLWPKLSKPKRGDKFYPWLYRYPQAFHILVEMAYQLGVEGLFGFKQMLKCLANEDFEGAAREMLDSTWYEQTPERVKTLADRMAGLASLGEFEDDILRELLFIGSDIREAEVDIRSGNDYSSKLQDIVYKSAVFDGFLKKMKDSKKRGP